jgi:1,4-alpha-glucan branching enzyme
MPILGPVDIHLLHEGTHGRLYEKLGAHPVVRDGTAGVEFAVWAPNAAEVSLIGDFTDWGARPIRLDREPATGIWHGFVAGLKSGAPYKYRVVSGVRDYRVDKADPYAFYAELPPDTASRVWDLAYDWGDAAWMRDRRARNALNAPQSIYEVHLGSWMRVPEEGHRWLTYRELAPRLAAHVKRLGFTHVELLPVMEHPFYASWGYQVTGFYAPTSRYGTPQDLMYLVDHLHQEGIGVILDWTPAHFPTDEHGLIYFDGTHVYEHADPRQGLHAHWGSAIFNYGRHEVRSFLVSNATFWIERYHIDGLRVDAVASMLYLDYGRKDGEWVANAYGGRENIEAIEFLRTMNRAVYREHPDVQTMAEESTSWPLVSRPPEVGGLGFGAKWDMGWMHDTLAYFAFDPIHRRHHHHKLTFRSMYADSENFVLPLSHDEVVHGKGSLLNKMPGDDWQKFANLRLLYAWMWGQPGKKLLFMGGEIAQRAEWNHDTSLDWHLREAGPYHAGIERLIAALNRLYRDKPAMYEGDTHGGFQWVAADDADHGVYAFLRKRPDGGRPVLAVYNATPVPRHDYRVGVDHGGRWRELLNTDAAEFGGSGIGNFGGKHTDDVPAHGRSCSLSLSLPPLGALFLEPE